MSSNFKAVFIMIAMAMSSLSHPHSTETEILENDFHKFLQVTSKPSIFYSFDGNETNAFSINYSIRDSVSVLLSFDTYDKVVVESIKATQRFIDRGLVSKFVSKTSIEFIISPFSFDGYIILNITNNDPAKA